GVLLPPSCHDIFESLILKLNFMKTLEIHFKRLIMLSFICSSFFFISCEKEERDPCSGMHCRNGGVCISGECFCFNGYSGKIGRASCRERCVWCEFGGS